MSFPYGTVCVLLEDSTVDTVGINYVTFGKLVHCHLSSALTAASPFCPEIWEYLHNNENLANPLECNLACGVSIR